MAHETGSTDAPLPTPSGAGFPAPGELVALLGAWLPRQRWFAAKGSQPQLEIAAALDVPATAPTRIYLVRDVAGRTPVLYQVPLTVLPADAAGEDAPGVVGEIDGGVLVDGCQDSAAALALLETVIAERELASPLDATGVGGASAVGHRSGGERSVGGIASLNSVTGARLLGGEQSNSSIVFTTTGEDADLIGKVFRMIHPGVNPDVEIQEALADAGCEYVPVPLGDLTGTWTGADGESATGHLFFVQEFVPGATDAWRVATAAAAQGGSFAERARALGRATADVHGTLAQNLPTRPADDEARAELARSWEQRLRDALEAVPDLAEHEEAMRAVLDAGARAEWPELQRVHGDFHLGQVLDVPDRGWVLLDFEGEPLRPLHERTLPDLAPRDVAGMLRSFDYAAGSVRLEHGTDVSRWAREARDAFLDGYAEAATPDADPRRHTDLLAALELDKALYEVVYEARNRPDWIDIPVEGVRRILGR